MALEVVAAVPEEADREDGANHGHRDHRGVGRAAVGAVAAFNIDASEFRETRNENPPTWEMGVTS